MIVVATTAVALSLPQQPTEAEAHRLPHRSFKTLKTDAKVRYLKRQVHHDKSALRFWHKRRSPHHYDTALRARDMRWHRVSLGIARRNLEPLERALFRSRLLNLPVPAIIRYVFGAYGSQAVTVASCESGLSVNAVNGQYLGLFQMGDYARSRYGHSSTAYGQSRAAWGYFSDSGYDWSPWACRP